MMYNQLQQPMMYQQQVSPPQPQQFQARPPVKLVQGSQVFDPHEVTAAVETLYADRLKPYGRILRKRLVERAAASGDGSVDVDIKHLKNICESCCWLYLQAEEGGDWSVLLRGRHPNFVDVYSPHDPYPECLWQDASAYFESLDDAKMVLPGGRYSCAQALISRGLQFLTGLTLGQICHIVQLAISQKKILGYLNGAVVPYGRSQSKVKERCAEHQKPCAATSHLADWDIVKKGLKEILDNLPAPGQIPLSNIKRLFRARYHVELSETSLGHAKLSELLQDPRLQDICSIRLQGHGYVVSPATAQLAQQQQQQLMPQPQQMMHCRQQQPMPMSSAAAGAAMIAAAAAAACGQPTPPQAAHLAQKGLQSNLRPAAAPAANSAVQQKQNGASLRQRARFVKPLSMEDVELSQHPLAASNAQGQASSVQPFADGMPFMTPTPNSFHLGTMQFPRTIGSDFEATGRVTALAPPQSSSEGSTATPGAPQNSSTFPVTPEGRGFPIWNPMTPNTLDNMGFSVQNTFINFPLPPPTPLAGSTLRSMSLPRNMGASDAAEDEKRMQQPKTEKDAPQSLAEAPKRAANRLMSAAAAAVRPAPTPRGDLKERGMMAAAALASKSGTPDAESKHHVVHLADFL